jgi:hypothetical protein
MWFSILVIAAICAFAVAFHKLLKEKWAGVAVAILIPVAFTVTLNQVLAEHREREGRRWTLQQDHVKRLKAVMQADAEKLSEVAERVEKQGTPLLSQNYNPGSSRNEMDARFSPDPLSGDIENHYGPYSQRKARLRNDVEEQDREHAELVTALVKMVALTPDHPHRETVARAVVWKCLGMGPGMTLKSDSTSYGYSLSGGGAGSGGGPAPPELREAFQAFTAFRADSTVATHCTSLRSRMAKIVDDARKLSAEARMLAERTTLSGDCEYTRLE